MAYLAAISYLIRPFRDNPVRLYAVIAGISGLFLLIAASEIFLGADFRKIPARDIAVNCGCSELLFIGKLQHPSVTDGFWRPKLFQSFNHKIPLWSSRNKRSSALIPAARDGKDVSTPEIVPIAVFKLVMRPVLSAIACYLTADG